ncbi:MAG: FliH/SctL family protein [Planctomycetaceae bacterium]
MNSLQITLKRSPRSLVVGDQTITIEFARDEEADLKAHELNNEATSESSGLQEPVPTAEPASSVESGMPEESETDAEGHEVSNSHLPTSVASVITDPAGRVMTPLALSNAVPVLSGATHEVVTAEEIGLGGVSEEELTELRQMLANTAELVMELQDQHRQSLHEMQEVAVELAVAATSWLTGVAIDRGEFAVDDLIRKALHQMEIDQPVRVRLNPADHDLLKNLIRDPAGRRMLENVSCFDDPELARGTCRVESGRRILLSDMESRLENIRRSWMEKLDDSQVERRGDGSTSRTLRRFPERRETA